MDHIVSQGTTVQYTHRLSEPLTQVPLQSDLSISQQAHYQVQGSAYLSLSNIQRLRLYESGSDDGVIYGILLS